MAQANAERLIGTTINERYEILELIAEGSRSHVYHGLHTAVNRKVALKVSRHELDLNSPRFIEFREEGKALANLIGTAIIERMIEFGVMPSGQPFLLLEYLEGATLEQLLEVDGKVGDEWLKVLITDGLEAVQFVHERGYLHRDLKPSKFMFMSPRVIESRFKLVGFGRAKKLDPVTKLTPAPVEGEDTNFSPLYCSPEVMDGDPAGVAADVYSLGCVLFQALTGYPPFYAETAPETVVMHKYSQPIAPSVVAKNPDLTRYDAVILKCLEKNPVDRYSSVAEIRKAIMDTFPKPNEKKSSGIAGFIRNMLQAERPADLVSK